MYRSSRRRAPLSRTRSREPGRRRNNTSLASSSFSSPLRPLERRAPPLVSLRAPGELLREAHHLQSGSCSNPASLSGPRRGRPPPSRFSGPTALLRRMPSYGEFASSPQGSIQWTGGFRSHQRLRLCGHRAHVVVRDAATPLRRCERHPARARAMIASGEAGIAPVGTARGTPVVAKSRVRNGVACQANAPSANRRRGSALSPVRHKQRGEKEQSLDLTGIGT